MKIKVFIKDAITNQVIRNDEVNTLDYSFQQMSNFHNRFKKRYPNAHINFSWLPKGAKQSSFICGMPLNMELDEIKLDKGQMSWDEYTEKWYKSADCVEVG
jgi:hypothetical protein